MAADDEPTSNEQIQSVIARLEEIPRLTRPCVQASADNVQKLLRVTGNREGLIDVALATLKAAVAPMVEKDGRSRPMAVSLSAGHAIDNPVDFTLCLVERIDDWPEPPEKTAERKKQVLQRDRIALLGCAVISILLFLIVYGAIAYWWSTLAGRPPV